MASETLGTVALLALVLAAGPSSADAPSASATASGVAAIELPLPELQELPPIERPAPKAAAAQALDARLEQLLGKEVSHPVDPRVDFGFLVGELDDDAVAAIAHRLEALRKTLDGDAAIALLERARKEGSRALDRAKKPRGADGGKKASPSSPGGATADPEGDWLQFALALRKRDSAPWRDLVQIYGMMRMLEALGTTPAVRELVNTYAFFGELVRIDLQRALERLKDRSVPALIEAREHDAKRVRDWARRELDLLGRAIPGEAVSTNDPAVLADVLVAFGRVKDVDAARVILSYVASDRVHLRRAARQAIVALGEAGVWHLRDAYESVTSEKPPRAWDHKRLAQELFRLHDRSRLTAVYELMDRGVGLAKQGDASGAVGLFDQVLARSPLFERRREMAASYAAHASALEREGKLDDALVTFRKAQRLDPDGPERQRLEARIAFVEGKRLVERGTPDPFVLRRAVELDPENAEARELLRGVEERTVREASQLARRAAALGVALAALLATVWLARRKPARADAPASGTPMPLPATDEAPRRGAADLDRSESTPRASGAAPTADAALPDGPGPTSAAVETAEAVRPEPLPHPLPTSTRAEGTDPASQGEPTAPLAPPETGD